MKRERLTRIPRRGGSRTALAKDTNQHTPSPLRERAGVRACPVLDTGVKISLLTPLHSLLAELPTSSTPSSTSNPTASSRPSSISLRPSAMDEATTSEAPETAALTASSTWTPSALTSSTFRPNAGRSRSETRRYATSPAVSIPMAPPGACSSRRPTSPTQLGALPGRSLPEASTSV